MLYHNLQEFAILGEDVVLPFCVDKLQEFCASLQKAIDHHLLVGIEFWASLQKTMVELWHGHSNEAGYRSLLHLSHNRCGCSHIVNVAIHIS